MPEPQGSVAHASGGLLSNHRCGCTSPDQSFTDPCLQGAPSSHWLPLPFLYFLGVLVPLGIWMLAVGESGCFSLKFHEERWIPPGSMRMGLGLGGVGGQDKLVCLGCLAQISECAVPCQGPQLSVLSQGLRTVWPPECLLSTAWGPGSVRWLRHSMDCTWQYPPPGSWLLLA